MLNPLRTWHFESCSTLKPTELAERFRTATKSRGILRNVAGGFFTGTWKHDTEREAEQFKVSFRQFLGERVEINGLVRGVSNGSVIQLTVEAPWDNWAFVLVDLTALLVLIGALPNWAAVTDLWADPWLIVPTVLVPLAVICFPLRMSMWARKMALDAIEELFPGEWGRDEGHRSAR